MSWFEDGKYTRTSCSYCGIEMMLAEISKVAYGIILCRSCFDSIKSGEINVGNTY